MRVSVADPFGATAARESDVAVRPDQTGPLVRVGFGRSPVDPDEAVRVRVTAVDDIGVRAVTLTAGGALLPLDADGYAAYTAPAPAAAAAGDMTFAAVVTDVNNNASMAAAVLAVRSASDAAAPTVVLTGPPDGDTVTNRAAIEGALSDAGGIVRYRVEAGLADGSEPFRAIADQTLAPAQTLKAGALAELDATGLKNGLYAGTVSRLAALTREEVVERFARSHTHVGLGYGGRAVLAGAGRCDDPFARRPLWSPALWSPGRTSSA